MEMPSLLNQRAEEILTFIESYRAEYGWARVVELAREKFVENEAQPAQQALGDLLLQARTLALVQGQLDDDRHALHSGRLNHEQDISIGHHYEMLRQEACTYNHQLRGFIESHRDSVDRYDLTRWLATASGGRHAWAESEITGAVSEIALHAALMGLPELVDLRYGSLGEDLHGYDFVATWQGRLLTVDAKTGYFHPLTEEKHGHEHLEIHVPRDVVQGFRLTRSGLDDLRRDVRGALRFKVGVEPHASHKHYAFKPIVATA
ncbi:hypothetical protein HJC99_01460 [Candidatus Saccharibacteria bacterium]|nr:hypothetical protein [Candidatus Saccharibacteria bacterium]